MKVRRHRAWWAAFRAFGERRHGTPEAAEMGTAFGLDSITVIDFEPSAQPPAETTAASRLQRRSVRRSRY